MSKSHQTVRLAAGNHQSPDHGVCIMELASMLSGEPFGDRPRCVSPVVAAAMRGYNDGIDDGRRQGLRRFAAAAVGTAGDRVADARRRDLIRASLPELPTGRGLRAAIARRLASSDPYEVMRAAGKRVAATDDDILHARMLVFLDRLVAPTGPATIGVEIDGLLQADTPAPRQPTPLPDDPTGGTLLP